MKRWMACGLAAVLCICATANAEMRIWTSKKGDTVEAEYVKMYGSKVVLKTAEGKTLHVPADGFCDDDQEYLSQVAAVPPKLLIKVSQDMESDKNSSSYPESIIEMLALDITVRKKNPEPCLVRFKTELYILGREEKNNQLYSIIDVVKREVSFIDSDLATLSEKFTIKYSVGYSYSKGFAYKGYLFCVKDGEGEVVAMDSNQNILERNLVVVLKSRKNDIYTEDFIKVD